MWNGSQNVPPYLGYFPLPHSPTEFCYPNNNIYQICVQKMWLGVGNLDFPEVLREASNISLLTFQKCVWGGGGVAKALRGGGGGGKSLLGGGRVPPSPPLNVAMFVYWRMYGLQYFQHNMNCLKYQLQE